VRVISLFSGAGGMDLGFIQAGHEIVWANDIDSDCVQTYQQNLDSHIVYSDIKEVDIANIPDAEIVIGGFPCQGFSHANLKRSTSDDRNSLYLEFLNVVKVKLPLYFVAENVRGLLSLAKGRVLEMILRDFSEAGYLLSYRLFNFADFGVPQTRYRVIIMGVRKDIPEIEHPKFPTPNHAKKTKLITPLKPWITISEALAGIAEPEELEHGLHNHVYSKYKVTNRNFTGHRRTAPDKPSPTILARGNGKGGVCAIQHPNNHRRLSVRESAIIQTFPKEFIFSGSMGSMYRQVGNAVPVLFAKQLAEEFKKLEIKKYHFHKFDTILGVMNLEKPSSEDYRSKNPSAINSLRVISLFAGAGGMDLGFLQAGHQIVWANEIWQDAADTYSRNINKHITLGNIEEVDVNNIPNGDIVIGGFPCQGFSVANTKRYIEDQRNFLYLQFLRVLRAKKPSFFLAENVKGILSLDKGKVFQMILDDFCATGYQVQYAVLNAANYGVPQRRERVFLFGVRKDLQVHPVFPPPPTHAPKEKAASLGLQAWLSIAEALEGVPEPDQPNFLANHEGTKYKLRFNGYLGHRRIDPTLPAPTITARGDDRGGVVIYHHPNNHRRLTVREAALIQSFPIDFVFVGCKTSAYRQIANAVPPLLAKVIASSIFSSSFNSQAQVLSDNPVNYVQLSLKLF
jgi:DNA (cytosine-5)-methyltransferase 1